MFDTLIALIAGLLLLGCVEAAACTSEENKRLLELLDKRAEILKKKQLVLELWEQNMNQAVTKI